MIGHARMGQRHDAGEFGLAMGTLSGVIAHALKVVEVNPARRLCAFGGDGDNSCGALAAWYFAVISRLIRPLLKTPAQGAQTSIHLSSAPDVEGVTGQFFANRRSGTANKLAYDANMTARLWQVSADLVGVTPLTCGLQVPALRRPSESAR